MIIVFRNAEKGFETKPTSEQAKGSDSQGDDHQFKTFNHNNHNSQLVSFHFFENLIKTVTSNFCNFVSDKSFDHSNESNDAPACKTFPVVPIVYIGPNNAVGCTHPPKNSKIDNVKTVFIINESNKIVL